MKNIFKLFALLCMVMTFTGCEDEEETLKDFDGTGLAFAETNFNLSIPAEDLLLEVPVNATSLAATSRTFNAVVTSATEGTANEYTIGSITIPANEYAGTLAIDFDFSEISGDDGEVKDLVVSIDGGDDVLVYNNVATISYFREIVCNNLQLDMVSDVYASETYFTIEQADGTAIVERFFPWAGINSTTAQTYSVEFALPDGDYVLKIGDSYGDGMVGTGGGVTLTGSYSLTCSIITHATGEGAFEGAVPDPFAQFSDATVEVTAFTVNP
jgi:hypothetical protein